MQIKMRYNIDFGSQRKKSYDRFFERKLRHVKKAAITFEPKQKQKIGTFFQNEILIHMILRPILLSIVLLIS